MARSRGIGRRLEAVVVLGASAALRALPLPARLAFGRRVGALFHAADRNHRELARRNIRAALGVPEAEAARIARETFLFFGRAFTEVLSLPAYIPRIEEFVEIEGFEHLQAAHARGRGVLVSSAHIGNWEFAGIRQCRAGIPLDYISRPLDNPWLYDRLIAWRTSGGVHTHEKYGAVRSAMKTLREGRTLAFTIDQDMKIRPRVFVPFFGRPASTTVTMAHLSLRMNAPIVPAYTIPRPDGRYLLRYAPAIEPPQGGDLDARAKTLTAEATRVLEAQIRETPWSWLWLHNRWKSKPEPGEFAGEAAGGAAGESAGGAAGESAGGSVGEDG